MTVQSPAIRYHGGKFRLAPWILGFFPEHRIYVEPFGGAAGVMIQKPRAYSEVYNDMDDELVNFFRVVQDASQRQQMEAALLWALYHLQGSRSPIGRPIRRLLGIGQHDALTEEQLARAKAFGGAA